LEVCAAQEFDGLAKIGNRQIVNRESSIVNEWGRKLGVIHHF